MKRTNIVLGVVSALAIAGCATDAKTGSQSCTYSEQLDKSNDINTANDVAPAGPEGTGLVLGTSNAVICGAVDQGDYTVNDDHTADGDSYQFTVAAHTTGTLALGVTDGMPPAPEFRVAIRGADPQGTLDMAETANASVGTPVAFGLEPGTYIVVMEARLATGPLSRAYPYEITFDVGAMP